MHSSTGAPGLGAATARGGGGGFTCAAARTTSIAVMQHHRHAARARPPSRAMARAECFAEEDRGAGALASLAHAKNTYSLGNARNA